MLYKKGIGIAQTTAVIPTKHYIFYPLIVLYPPKYVVIKPPIITPAIGAVKLNAK